MSRRAVLLLNLGSPSAPTVPAIRSFLREFLGDPKVLDMPAPLRWLLLNTIILPRRPHRTLSAYQRIWTEHGAPLHVHTGRLRAALEAELARRTPTPPSVHVAMRYGKPGTRGAIAALVREGMTDLLVLPQYPHYAKSSYATAVELARAELQRQAPQVRVRIAEPYYDAPGYIAALVASARPFLERPFDMLLFSYHGIPLRHQRETHPGFPPDAGEPRDYPPQTPHQRARDYRHQCCMTMEAFASAARIAREKCTLAFQSRLGRAAWIQPYTDATLKSLPARGVKRLLVICPAFTADCLETLEEIREEGRALFLESGGESFEQIPCLNDHPAYVHYLANLTGEWLAQA
ncbi:MAG: ferrochelatase [Puniceicoccales bacterium]|jgi:ferrochelatase|nr:ferrochelatase [Puniceicoccales bacterium]